MGDQRFNEFAVGRGQVEEAMRIQTLLAWTLAGAYSLSQVTRDAYEAITTATITWPNGETGTFTALVKSAAFPGAIDSYSVTYVYGNAVTRTITQPAVTRDANGAITAQPSLTIA